MNTMLILITTLIIIGLLILAVTGVLYWLLIKKPFNLK
jgi:nitrogen fixation-related uncharacterized protein